MTELFNNYFYEIAVALGFVLFLLMKRLKNYFYQKKFKESLKKYYCKKIKYKAKVQKFVKFTRKLTKKHQEKIKKLNENLKWVKHYRDKYYEEITKFSTEVQNAINIFEREKERDIRREAERKIEEFKEQKYIEDINAIEKIVKIKNLDERFKLIADQKKDNYFLRYNRHDIIHSFLRETLLALKQCEDENEGVKAELNLQVSANYLLVKEIEELKKTNINNFINNLNK